MEQIAIDEFLICCAKIYRIYEDGIYDNKGYMKLLFSDFAKYSSIVYENMVEIIDMIEGSCMPGVVIIFIDYQIATMTKTATATEILLVTIFKGLFLDKLSGNYPGFEVYDGTFNTFYQIYSSRDKTYMHITEILCADPKKLAYELDIKFNIPSRKEENERMDKLYEELILNESTPKKNHNNSIS